MREPDMLIPYYPTINEDQNPEDERWVTAEFNGSLRDTLTFCEDNIIEEGDIELVYFGQPGVGYQPLMLAMEADLVTLMSKRDDTGKLVFVRRSAPYDYSSGSANMMYALSVYIDYQFYE